MVIVSEWQPIACHNGPDCGHCLHIPRPAREDRQALESCSCAPLILLGARLGIGHKEGQCFVSITAREPERRASFKEFGTPRWDAKRPKHPRLELLRQASTRITARRVNGRVYRHFLLG